MNLKTPCYLIFTVIFSGCDYYDGRLEVHNSTSHVVAVETFLDSIPTLSELNKTEYYIQNSISPNETKRLIKMGSTKGWSFRIKKASNNRLNLFVFQVDSLKTYGIDSLISLGIYDRYMFPEVHLDENNWKVIIE
ncbi:hypothetical protein [Algoriphagus antarcticus]|uniref:Lipoprotein n=1 Tax=Algoriphagus antarcticus TaxID=238540 RepID=A0A3E0D2Y6_9BACT|nr:hypothetical protein [Algoriphagus antarcticus]REG76887.1 hypothetical protein C8N25_1545 [Algoriphagus antarcticus]